MYNDLAPTDFVWLGKQLIFCLKFFSLFGEIGPNEVKLLSGKRLDEIDFGFGSLRGCLDSFSL